MSEATKIETKAAATPKDPNAFVPLVCLISEAGLGLRRGEIRGFSPAVAEKMKEGKHARDLTANERQTGKAVLTEDAA